VTAIALMWVYATAFSTAHSWYTTTTLPCMTILGGRIENTAEKRKITQGEKVISELHPFPEPFHQTVA